MRARAVRRKGPLVVVAALGVAAFIACASSNDGSPSSMTGSDDAAPDVPLTDATNDANVPPPSGEIQILAFSDFRGQLDPLVEEAPAGFPQTYGGLAALAAYFANDSAGAPPTLVVSSGDTFGASPLLSSAFGDLPTARGLDFLGTTAGTFGQHDFERGTAALGGLLADASFRAVSTNLTNVVVEVGPKVVTPFLLLDVGDAGAAAASTHLRVAVIGLTNPDVGDLQFPSNLGTITARDPVAVANKSAADARLIGANVVVAIAHVGDSGLDTDGTPIGPLWDMAKELQGIDVLFGGSGSVAFVKSVAGDGGAPMLVLQNRGKGRTYARVHVRVGPGGGVSGEIVEPQVHATASALCDAGADADADATCVCPSSPCASGFSCSDASLCERQVADASAEVGSFLASYRSQLPAVLDQMVATASAAFTRDGTELSHETALGDLVADALLQMYKPAGAQIALVPGAHLLASLPSSYVPTTPDMHRAAPPFDLLRGDVQQMFDPSSTAVVRSLKGRDLWQVFEQSLALAPDAPSASFVQVAGVVVTYSKGADAGARVKTVTFLDGMVDIPSDDPTVYAVVLPDSMSSGGDGYPFLIGSIATPGRDLLGDSLLAHLKAQQTPFIVPTTFTRVVAVP